jgi:Asp-tRNA(Asn)/Glu-tRNA(Gln) amidotransferase A subunit family amidase
VNNIKELVLNSGLMKDLMKDLTDEEIKEMNEYVEEFISPLDDISMLVKDMMSTESSRERLASDILKLFTPEGNEELEKCLEKN